MMMGQPVLRTVAPEPVAQILLFPVPAMMETVVLNRILAAEESVREPECHAMTVWRAHSIPATSEPAVSLPLTTALAMMERSARRTSVMELQVALLSPSLWERLAPLACLLYTSPSPRDVEESRMPSSA